MGELMKADTFSLVPSNLKEAMDYAKLLAESDLVPKAYQGHAGNILVCVQHGAEIGLKPLQSLASIAVINGRPGLYGDAGKALLLSAGLIIEEDDAAIIKKTGMGRCRITRPGHPPCERTFSIENAKVAGLWGKSGPWTQYPERQMAWRAFWFAARDIASDLLKGLSGAEEAIDIPPRDITPMNAPIEHGPQPYPADKFAANLPTWRALIEKGTKSAADIIAVVSSKAALTEEQKAQIIGKPAVNQETGETPSLLDDVKRICAAALAIPDRDTAFTKLDDARVLLPEMKSENRELAIKEIDAAMEAIKARE